MKSRALVVLSAVLVTLSHPFAIGSFDALSDSWNGLLAWVALVPWWLAVRDKPAREVFKLTWLCADFYFLGTLFWLVNATHTFGGLSLPTSVVTLLLLCGFIALFPAGAAYFARRAEEDGGFPAAWTVPIAWVGAEWMRGVLFTGFPWANPAYSQWKLLPVIQIAEITGVYGITALLLLVNIGIAEGFVRRRFPAIAIAATLPVLMWGAVRIARPLPAAPEIGVALVQGNVTQEMKHDRERSKEITAIYAAEHARAEESGADLIVWPEAAIPAPVHMNSSTLTERQLPEPNRTWLLAGSASWWHEEKELLAHNSALLIAPGRRIIDRYHKTHLVPFGEYVPLRRVLFFMRKLTQASGSFLPGTDFAPLEIAGTGPDARPARFGVLICYEDIFPDVSRKMVARGAGFLVNITNDAWYGRTSAPYQHLSMSVFRAVESRRAVVRAAQSGISAIVLPSGRIAARTEIFEGPETLVGTIPAEGPLTFYVRFGDVFAAACLAMATALLRAKFRNQRAARTRFRSRVR